jgi:predicted DNA-binding transcriptional regulator YafY
VRHEKAADLLKLALSLAGSAEGLTLDEMSRSIGVGRRTVERMRDALRELFPQMEEVDDPPTKRFRIPGGLDRLFQAPSPEELAALHRVAEQAGAQGAHGTAENLHALEAKLLSSLRGSDRRRIAPDLEAVMQGEAIAIQPGPRPTEDPALLSAVREAIKGGQMIAFKYQGGSNPGARREATPLGLILSRRNYLVAAAPTPEGSGSPRTFRLDRLSGLEVLDKMGSPPAGFSLQAFADESVGIYQDQMEDVSLVFNATAAPEAGRWRFHASQTVEPLGEDEGGSDGEVRVRFRARGMRELAWHLITWGPTVRVEAPQRLRELLVTELKAALSAHDSAAQQR